MVIPKPSANHIKGDLYKDSTKNALGLCYSELVLLAKLWDKSNKFQKDYIILNNRSLRLKVPEEMHGLKTAQKEQNKTIKMENNKEKRNSP